MISFRIGNNRLIFYVDFLGLLLFPRIYPYLHTLLSPELIILTINLKRVAGLLPPSFFSLQYHQGTVKAHGEQFREAGIRTVAGR